MIVLYYAILDDQLFNKLKLMGAGPTVDMLTRPLILAHVKTWTLKHKQNGKNQNTET